MRVLCSLRKPMGKTPVLGFPRALFSISHAQKRRGLESRLSVCLIVSHALLQEPFSRLSATFYSCDNNGHFKTFCECYRMAKW